MCTHKDKSFIESSEGVVDLNGSVAELLAEYACITLTLIDAGINYLTILRVFTDALTDAQCDIREE